MRTSRSSFGASLVNFYSDGRRGRGDAKADHQKQQSKSLAEAKKKKEETAGLIPFGGKDPSPPQIRRVGKTLSLIR